MKNTILFVFSILMIALVGCGEDEKAAQDAEIKSEVLGMQKKWEDYKVTINGNYQLVYVEAGFVQPTGEQTTTVKDGQVSLPERVQCEANETVQSCESRQPKAGTLSMDRLYTSILDLFENEHCELDSIVFEDTRPVIKRYKAFCGDEEYTLTVKSFTPDQQ